MSSAGDRGGAACAACGAELPSVFPGASITCVCGHRVDIGGARASHGPQSLQGPYRTADASHDPHPSAPCPFCGNECPAMVRICPHCDVRLENVRCQRCFSLQVPGTFACVRCGHGLELEPLLDASDAPCPRCSHALEAVPGEDTRVHECPRCGGIFVPREVFAEILSSAEVGGALREAAPPPRAPAVDDVRYLPCPLCHTAMNRVNFGKVSGVIVDVCKKHGTWFDAGELTRVVAFASHGGLEKTRAREREEKREEKAHEVHEHAKFVAMESHERFRSRTEMWSDFLSVLFRW